MNARDLFTTEVIWERFSGKLKRFILARVRDSQIAEDILQDVFVKIHSRIGTLEDGSKLESWVYQIARNAVADHYRTRELTIELSEALPAEDEVEADDDAAQRLGPALKAIVESLPDDYREAIVVTEYEGLSQKELSEKLGISFSGAKSRVQRARDKLRQMLLDCCHFEFDRLGGLIDYEPNPGCCERCACER
jgi:RNA polymerase sigma-70 factor (ECF subfamily)